MLSEKFRAKFTFISSSKRSKKYTVAEEFFQKPPKIKNFRIQREKKEKKKDSLFNSGQNFSPPLPQHPTKRNFGASRLNAPFRKQQR